MQFYELNSSRMDYRELSADDLNLLTPLLRSEETMQTLGGTLSYEQTLDWLVDTLRRYQAEGCGWLLALDKPTGVPAALCGLTYEQVGAERVLTANCIVRHELRGIGVGRECIAACLLYAFESMHADEVSAFVQKDDLAGLHTAVACRMQPTEKVSHTAFGKTAPCVRCVVRIRTSQRRQNQKMNCRKMKRAPKREFRCSFVIILCDTHCLAMVHVVYTVRQGRTPKLLAALLQSPAHPTVKSVIK